MKYVYHLGLLIMLFNIHYSFQICEQETTMKGISVVWPETENGSFAQSNPECYTIAGEPIIRFCNITEFIPTQSELPACMQILETQFTNNTCPPGFHGICENYTRYCFQITEASVWDYPCMDSAGRSLIIELEEDELIALFQTLQSLYDTRSFWLPGHRRKAFNPAVWTVPGSAWGTEVVSGAVEFRESIFKNCLSLDLEREVLTTERCNTELPSLCLLLNNPELPMTCPDNYYAFRYLKDQTKCFGVEYSMVKKNWSKFTEEQCRSPMNIDSEIDALVFVDLAERSNLSENKWCWSNHSPQPNTFMEENYKRAINRRGEIGVFHNNAKLNCIVCEKNTTIKYTEIILSFDQNSKKLHLTIYYPSGLWKDSNKSRGFQCFSNANGFTKVVIPDDDPLVFETDDDIRIYTNTSAILTSTTINKYIYTITPIAEHSGQYWCEAFTGNFTFIRTKILLLELQDKSTHVFSLVIGLNNTIKSEQTFPDLEEVVEDVGAILNAKQVFLMDILEMNMEYIVILLHVHMELGFESNDGSTLKSFYEKLISNSQKAMVELGYTFVNMSSATHCLPEFSESLNWMLTGLGNTVAPEQFCLKSNGLPVTRSCVGSFMLGALWGNISGICSLNYQPTNTTEYLYNVAQSQCSDDSVIDFLTEGLIKSLENIDFIIPADIFYLSMSLQNALHYLKKNYSTEKLHSECPHTIAWAMNQIMEMDGKYLKLAQTLNSTNVIIDSIDEITKIMASSQLMLTRTNSLEYNLIVEPRYVIQISNTAFNNVTGIAVIRNSESSLFTNMSYQPLFGNSTINNVLNLNNLELAAWVPNSVISSMRPLIPESIDENLQRDIKIYLSLFYNDAVFPQISTVKHTVNSRIVGISIPNYDTNLQYPVIIIFKKLLYDNTTDFCGFWDFGKQDSDSVPGFWNDDGCNYLGSHESLSICLCYHLTHFGQLIQSQDYYTSSSSQHEKALNVITLVGTFLSLLGVFGIWITALIFQNWRQKPGSKILIQLSISISIPLVLMIVLNYNDGIFTIEDNKLIVAEEKRSFCVLIGATLQYTVLSSFSWMLITAVLQFMRFVRVLGIQRPSNYMFKFTLIGWGLPLIPISVSLLVDHECYIPAPADIEAHASPMCYPTGRHLIYGLLVPVGVILLTNLTLFLMVVYSISVGPDGKLRTTECLIGAQLRLSIFLFFLLGLSWIFGFISYTNDGLIWSYLFCLTATLQGFVLFVYFIICDPSTRELWLSLLYFKNENLRDLNTLTSDLHSRSSISSGYPK